MRAAVLERFGAPLTLLDRAAPELGLGEVLVDVVATGVLPYADEVFSGERRYALTLPVVPGLGAVGRVRATGPDATHLAVGDAVLVDPTIRSRDGGPTPDITLQGWSGRGPGGLALQRRWGDGSFAEQLRAPTENAIPLGLLADDELDLWCALVVCLVPYGGLRAGALQPGETVLVSGATGNYGSGAVAVALAMGARTVVCPGRNTAVLDDLVRRFGDRVRPVVLTGEEDVDRAAMQAAAPGPVDLVLDLLPPEAPATVARAAAMTVREYGRVVLMGGVGMLGGDDLALPYPWIMRNSVTVRGQWMYLPDEARRLVELVHAGLLDLSQWAVTGFPLEQVNDAVAHAAADGGRFSLTVVRPSAS
ncbi:alcohol dehydrogenase catalytic domain-containing protein [Actinomycetospora atypica]|uniref:Alcohol dehydrogenase catalytic domain-containing protein n=1 Tax=Actinomycetospora atypica TaxID=1290095 RepID=A0ABV9YMT4_9PSEU